MQLSFLLTAESNAFKFVTELLLLNAAPALGTCLMECHKMEAETKATICNQGTAITTPYVSSQTHNLAGINTKMWSKMQITLVCIPSNTQSIYAGQTYTVEDAVCM